MTRAFRLGLVYFGAVFALGFALGTIRTIALIPVLGEVGAVLVELPVILSGAWWICGRIMRGRGATVTEAALTGGTAFLLLMAGEACISLWLAGRTLADHFALYAEPAHQIGLAGQLAFAAFPVLRRRDRAGV